MMRLFLHVEGQTEETFVNEVLAEHLRSAGYFDVRARLAGNIRKQRGGIGSWQEFRRDILQHLKEEPHCNPRHYRGLLRIAARLAGPGGSTKQKLNFREGNAC